MHAGLMLPAFNMARSRTHIYFYNYVFYNCVCACVCVKVIKSEVCRIDFRWIRYSCRLVYIIMVMQIYHVSIGVHMGIFYN